MRIGVLGPMQLATHATMPTVPVTATKDRMLLAELVVHLNRLVATDHLVDMLWGDDIPEHPANALQTRVSRLRAVIKRALDVTPADAGTEPVRPLDPDEILRTRPGGYQLDLSRSSVDAVDFVALIAQARRTTDPAERVRILTEAEALWRGPAYGETVGGVCIAGESLRLEEMRLVALEERHAAELNLGLFHEAIPELVAMVEANPMRERPRVQLMYALYRCGRAAEALQVYQDVRAMLGAELGLDPSSALQRLQEAVLSDDLRLAAEVLGPMVRPTVAVQRPVSTPAREDDPATRPATPAPRATTSGTTGTTTDAADAGPADAESAGAVLPAPRPANAVPAGGAPANTPDTGPESLRLPPAVATFTGRTAELDALCAMLLEPAGAGTRLAAVYGPGGTGKSALVVHAARRVRDAFGDAQLHLNLQGFTTGMKPVEPFEALSRFLAALGVPDTEVPATLEDARRLYLALTDRRRVLVVLDNVASLEQVAPLIPSGAGCAALVTSRQPLTALDGAVHVRLTGLPTDEAVALLRRLVGTSRTDADPAATARLAELCDGLPLALRIAGTRLATRPNWPVTALVDQLADEQRRLDELHVADLAVRGSIQLSYDELRASGPDGAQALRVLQAVALLPIRDITSRVAAAVLGEDCPAHVARRLEHLVDAQLLESPAPDRYLLHDLTRLAVRELASRELPDSRETLLARLADDCRRSAEAARGLFGRSAKERAAAIPAGDRSLPFTDRTSALSWFRVERANLVQVVHVAAALGTESMRPALRLADALAQLLHLDLRLYDLLAVCESWLDLALKLDDKEQQGDALDMAAFAHVKFGRQRGAVPHLEAALRIFEELGDRPRQAHCLGNLGLVHNSLGEFDTAVRRIRRALALCRLHGASSGIGDNWNNLGEVRFARGDYPRAIFCYRRAGEHYEQVGDINGAAISAGNVGAALLRSGDPVAARPLLEQAEQAHLEFGDREALAQVRTYLSELHRAAGDPRRAAELAEQTLGIAVRDGWRAGEAHARYALGRAKLDLGEMSEARAELSRALDLVGADRPIDRVALQQLLDAVPPQASALPSPA